MKNEELKGIIDWYDFQKRYGFILTNEKKYFFHQDDLDSIEYKPKKNDEVIFFPIKTKKGLRAKRVKFVKQFINDNNTLKQFINDNNTYCRACKKKMTPRLVTYKGSPDKSFCPHCGKIHMTFFNFQKTIEITVIIIFFSLVLLYFFNK